ncbi:discoidin domain-containing protein [Kitasatospora sp. NPDC048298]|uniref:discoidin domain-containing protein n=1 Tax=Kitasatospora sp. NPDC048298 TaxID=3364049 RepID=UPI003712D97E
MALEKDEAIVSLVGDTNLIAGKPIWASSSSQENGPDMINRDSGSGWWESKFEAPLPQWLLVDLGSQRTVRRIVLKVSKDWPAPNRGQNQSQTLTVEGSADGKTFTTLVPSARYDFTPDTTIDLPGAGVETRCIRLFFTANNSTGFARSKGAFLRDFEVYGNAGEQPGPDDPPLDIRNGGKVGETDLGFGTQRNSLGHSIWMNFKGKLSWDGQGGYVIEGQLRANSSSEAPRSTVWLEYGGESESWKKSPETETREGREKVLAIQLTGKLARGEKLEVRLGSWQGAMLGIGSTETTEKKQYKIS